MQKKLEKMEGQFSQLGSENSFIPTLAQLNYQEKLDKKEAEDARRLGIEQRELLRERDRSSRGKPKVHLGDISKDMWDGSGYHNQSQVVQASLNKLGSIGPGPEKFSLYSVLEGARKLQDTVDYLGSHSSPSELSIIGNKQDIKPIANHSSYNLHGHIGHKVPLHPGIYNEAYNADSSISSSTLTENMFRHAEQYDDYIEGIRQKNINDYQRISKQNANIGGLDKDGNVIERVEPRTGIVTSDKDLLKGRDNTRTNYGLTTEQRRKALELKRQQNDLKFAGANALAAEKSGALPARLTEQAIKDINAKIDANLPNLNTPEGLETHMALEGQLADNKRLINSNTVSELKKIQDSRQQSGTMGNRGTYTHQAGSVSSDIKNMSSLEYHRAQGVAAVKAKATVEPGGTLKQGGTFQGVHNTGNRSSQLQYNRDRLARHTQLEREIAKGHVTGFTDELISKIETHTGSTGLKAKLNGGKDTNQIFKSLMKGTYNKIEKNIQTLANSLKDNPASAIPDFSKSKGFTLVHDSRPVLDQLKQTFSSSIFGQKADNFLMDIAKAMPNHYTDAVSAAAYLGADVRQSTGGLASTWYNKIRSNLGLIDEETASALEKQTQHYAHNRIDGSKMNIDYLNNMGRGWLGQKVFGSSGKGLFGTSLFESNQELWKRMYREETSKSVRKFRGNIDPFDNLILDEDATAAHKKSTSESIKKAEDKLKALTEETSTSAEHRKAQQKEIKSLREEIKTKKEALNESVYKSNPLTQTMKYPDGTTVDGYAKLQKDLETSKKRLEEAKKLKGNQYHDFFDSPEERKAKTERFKEETKKLNQEIKELESNIKKYEKGWIKTSDPDFIGPLRPGEQWIKPKYTQWYRPTQGTSGYGLGMSRAMKASGWEHAARAMHYTINPLTVVGNTTNSLMEGFGIMNSRQILQFQQARGFAKIPHLAVPLLGGGILVKGIIDGDSPGEIMGMSLGGALAQTFWRAGTAYGAAVGTLAGRTVRAAGVLGGAGTGLGKASKIAQAGKLIGMGAGGLLAGGIGTVVGTALMEGLEDMASQDSRIRKFAKKAGEREMYARIPDTQQSLSARQASLQKLARSGLNDRGQLLGSEAAVLSGIM